MAITRAQQFKQMLQNGGRIGFRVGTGEGKDTSGRDYGGSPDRDFGGRGDNTRTRIQDERQRDFQKQQLRELTRNIDFDQGDTSLDIKQQPRGLGNLASLILSGATDLPFALFNKIRSSDLSGPPQFAGLEEMDFGPANPKFLFPRMAQGPRTMDTMPTEEEEEKKEPEMFRYLAKGGMADEVVGGEMDFESARQMYGLGKLVKKVTRTVKKIAKSPIGKAALAFGAYKLGGMGFGKSNLSLFERFGDLTALQKAGVISSGILTASPFFMKQKQEDIIPEEEGADIDDPQTIMANAFRYQNIRTMAEGGSTEKEPVAKKTMPLLDMGGMEKDYREDGGFVPIGRMEKADDVPARLSKNEFVFTADAVRNAGDGNVDKGAEVMYNMMKNLEAGGEVSEESQGLEGARKMFQTSQRLGEVV